MRTQSKSIINFLAIFALLLCKPAVADDEREDLPRQVLNPPVSVKYAQGLLVDEVASGCDWRDTLLQSLRKNADEDLFVKSGVAPESKPFSLAIEIVGLQLTGPLTGKREYLVTARADVSDGGFLVATNDFHRDASFRVSDQACPTLRKIANSIGDKIAGWAESSRFQRCSGACAGIHPDEPIVTGDTLLVAHEASVDAELTKECRWDEYVLKGIVSRFNETEFPPRAGVQVRKLDIEAYAGRKLVLRIENSHVISGGIFTGPKWLSMSGELIDHGFVVGSFSTRKTLGVGSLSSCKTLRSLGDDMSERIADWLRMPALDSKL